jgi:thioredoxin reductase (NADPH)
MTNYHVAIIGSGPVGLFAAFQAGLLGMNSCVIDVLENIGGQCSVLYPEKPIYDIPSHPKILGQDLINQLKIQADQFNPDYYLGQQVISCEKDFGYDCFKITTSAGVEIFAKTVLIVAGCGAFGPNRPPLHNIEQFEGKSIFYSVHNRMEFANKNIVIAGGGDSAVDWAISLSEVAKKVFVVHRRDKFRAMQSSINKMNELAEKKVINLFTGYQLESISGSEDGYLSKVKIADLKNQAIEIDADVLLPFFGLSQNLGPILNWGLGISSNHIEVSMPYYQSSIDGIYACGDVATYNGKLKLILTGFAEVASSLHHAYKRVFDGKELHFEYSTNRGALIS